MITITDEEFQLLGGLIRQECGIVLQDDKKYLIESRLANLVIEQGCMTFGEFYNKAKSTLNTNLKEKIVDAMTTNETLWFRDEGPFKVLQEKLLPQFSEEFKEGKRTSLKIWSAACSSGQEPYSIAMIFHEFNRLNPSKAIPLDKVTIQGTDISPSVLMLAKMARYNTISMSRGIDETMQNRYFEHQGNIWVLKDEIKNMVTFQQFNLQQSFLAFGKFDIVFLRNVAIYFAPDFKIELFQKIANALNKDGYMFIGASETLIGYSEAFNLLNEKQSLYYQVKQGA